MIWLWKSSVKPLICPSPLGFAAVPGSAAVVVKVLISAPDLALMIYTFPLPLGAS